MYPKPIISRLVAGADFDWLADTITRSIEQGAKLFDVTPGNANHAHLVNGRQLKCDNPRRLAQLNRRKHSVGDYRRFNCVSSCDAFISKSPFGR